MLIYGIKKLKLADPIRSISRVIKYAMLHYLWDPWCCGEANRPIHLDKGLANDLSFAGPSLKALSVGDNTRGTWPC